MARTAFTSSATLALLGVTAAAIIGRTAARPRAAQATPMPARAGRHRVVILGAGFGGLQAATELAHVPDIDLCVIDRHNHHLFQPLLYQVATAVLSPDDIATPVRDTIAPISPTTVHYAAVTGVDPAARHVICDNNGANPIPYDTLVIATGSQPSYFGHGDWAKAAPGLKTLADAIALRQQILGAFEQAIGHPAGSAERRRASTFVLIGGGATGVEMAGSIAELAHDTMRRNLDGPHGLDPKIILIDAGKRVLAEFPLDLSRRAAADLASLGVDIRTGLKVENVEPGRVHAGGQIIEADTIIWAAGVEATPVAEWLGLKPGHGKQVPVGPNLTVNGHPDIFIIGDAALATGRNNKPLPGLAPVAKQQGHYVARTIKNRLRGQTMRRKFRYRDYGTLATIGRNRAVAEFGPVHLTGIPAFFTWAIAHIFFLITARSRILVGTQWALSYLTNQRGGRIIT